MIIPVAVRWQYGTINSMKRIPLWAAELRLCGALGRTRTCNLLIRSQMLCPLSYERRARELRFRLGTIPDDGSRSPGCRPASSTKG